MNKLVMFVVNQVCDIASAICNSMYYVLFGPLEFPHSSLALCAPTHYGLGYKELYSRDLMIILLE